LGGQALQPFEDILLAGDLGRGSQGLHFFCGGRHFGDLR
jgi:hypothetical protein